MILYPWLFVAPVIAITLIVLYSLTIHRSKHYHRKSKRNETMIAHTSAIRNLPEYKKAKKRYLMLIILAAIFLFGAIASTVVVASRPVSTDSISTEYDNRDIMLCLDVSGSTNDTIGDMLSRLQHVVSEMKGERFGIVAFDGVPITVSPLSNDYKVIDQLLESIKDNQSIYLSASHTYSLGSSLIGPGLVGCVNSFDHLDDTERSRSIILFTDNYASYTQPVNIIQAAKYAKRYGITIYGINPADYSHVYDGVAVSGTDKEYMEAVALTGGSYYAASSKNTDVNHIIDQIMEQQSALLEGAEKYIKTDSPGIAILVAFVMITVYLVVIWRLRL